MDTRRGEISNRPLVSVIIIFLNAERFIQEAIESVFAQSYDAWELLLIDDGSTDGSTVIARGCAQQAPDQVHYLEHEAHQNLGKAASRNLGVANAKGEYLAFLDADDVWLPHKLEQQVAILEAHPEAGMVYGLTQWWYSWTGKPEDSQRDFAYEFGIPSNTLLKPPVLFTPYFLTQEASIPSMSNILIRHDIVERIGGFEEDFRAIANMYEDQAFYAKTCLATPVITSSKCWDRYRQHPDSSCAVAATNGQDFEARRFFLKWLAGYINSQGLRGTDMWYSLHKQIWLYRYRILHLLVKGRQPFLNRIKDLLLRTGRRTMPAPMRHWLWTRWYGQSYSPLVGRVRLGSLRRLTPFSHEFGYDRGRPIDRYYIENFLLEHRGDVQGHVLEIADDNYTRHFGGERVRQSDVLHVAPGEPKATIIGDLTSLDHVLSDTFDCIILTQTLQVIYDVRAALQTVYRILKPGGVVIATFPGLSPVSSYDRERWGYFWGFTSLSAKRLFEEVFPDGCVQVKAYGNVLTAAAFLYGMATEELKREEVEHVDPDYEVIVAVRARKPDPRGEKR